MNLLTWRSSETIISGYSRASIFSKFEDVRFQYLHVDFASEVITCREGGRRSNPFAPYATLKLEPLTDGTYIEIKYFVTPGILLLLWLWILALIVTAIIATYLQDTSGWIFLGSGFLIYGIGLANFLLHRKGLRKIVLQLLDETLS